MFKVEGKINKKGYTLIYDGVVSGDDAVVEMVGIIAESMEGRLVGTGYQYTMYNHLDDPVSAYIILTEHVFDEVVSVTGDIPELESVPDGAVV